MTDLVTRFSDDLQLKGLSIKTIRMYTRAVKQLTKHYKKSQEKICGWPRHFFYIQMAVFIRTNARRIQAIIVIKSRQFFSFIVLKSGEKAESD